MEKKAKIFVAGHRGLVGSAIAHELEKQGYTNLLFKTHDELDLTNQQATAEFFAAEKPEYVILAAAKVGGIMANKTYPADFIYNNLMIESNVIHESHTNNVKKLLFLGSSCIYPKLAPQPMKEEHLLTGKLEPTNDAYAIAKIAGILMCKSYNTQHGTNFIAAMPTNLYGPRDNFDLKTSHVLPALIRKFHEAKGENKPEVTAWGTGSPLREFLYIDDLAEACVFLMNEYNPTKEQNNEGDIFLNVGTGEEVSIKELTELISDVVGYNGSIDWDTSKPDGTPRKLMDPSRINQLGWKAKTPLREGIEKTYAWYKENLPE